MQQYSFKNAMLLALKRIHLSKLSSLTIIKLNRKFQETKSTFFKIVTILFDEDKNI